MKPIKFIRLLLLSSFLIVGCDNPFKKKDDETDVKQILERFYRASSNKKEGSGIGLSITDEIVKLHSGKIKAEKTNNVITFYVTF